VRLIIAKLLNITHHWWFNTGDRSKQGLEGKGVLEGGLELEKRKMNSSAVKSIQLICKRPNREMSQSAIMIITIANQNAPGAVTKV